MRILSHINKNTTKDIKGSEILFTQKGELKVFYKSMITEIFQNCENKEHELTGLKYWARNKGHNTLVDREYYRAIEILKALNIPFTEVNNAPRGGVTGDAIVIKYDGRNANVKAMRQLVADVRANLI